MKYLKLYNTSSDVTPYDYPSVHYIISEDTVYYAGSANSCGGTGGPPLAPTDDPGSSIIPPVVDPDDTTVPPTEGPTEGPTTIAP